MAVSRYKYKNINDTLRMLILQVVDSYEYAFQVCPKFNNPEQIFNWLKLNTTFRDDPPGQELLQTMPTMFEGKIHRTPGGGDCDCFVIAGIACLKINGFDDIAIILCGRDKVAPVHIYLRVLDGEEWKVFDLTNRYYNEMRPYRYSQFLRI